jgi:hypothetical protein
MADTEWYEVTQGDLLFQGDLLMNCPVCVVASDLPLPVPEDHAPEIDLQYFDLIVMTQSCDLANDKIEEILLAQVIAWPEAVKAGAAKNPFIKSKEYRRKLIAGDIPGVSLLNKHEEFPVLPWSVVDFHRLFMLPKQFARRFAMTCGPRLRLRSPYLEHLSQAFARYFMRVGLPHPLQEFEKEGQVDP